MGVFATPSYAPLLLTPRSPPSLASSVISKVVEGETTIPELLANKKA